MKLKKKKKFISEVNSTYPSLQTEWEGQHNQTEITMFEDQIKWNQEPDTTTNLTEDGFLWFFDR